MNCFVLLFVFIGTYYYSMQSCMGFCKNIHKSHQVEYNMFYVSIVTVSYNLNLSDLLKQ